MLICCLNELTSTLTLLVSGILHVDGAVLVSGILHVNGAVLVSGILHVNGAVLGVLLRLTFSVK